MSLPFLIPQFIQSYFELKNHALTQGKKKSFKNNRIFSSTISSCISVQSSGLIHIFMGNQSNFM